MLPIKFSSFDCCEVVQGFQAFHDIPSPTEMSVATLIGGNEGMSTQPSCDESPINLEKDVDEAAPDPNVRPIERKATKEAHRKGKAAKEESHVTYVVVTLANSQASILSSKEKRDKAYARQL
ncbi:hypothetical protein ACLB2K_074570 [Fragaria x ananassa]